MEHLHRSIIKSITWRIIGFVTTTIFVYLYTGDIKESLVIGFGVNCVKMFLYYIHERVWNRIKFGRMQPPEYQI
ncbi:MAG: DUF2061 domain-containing protein [Candidatus Omnitrophica bacterium]|nr:DUF2061 domain-containing protein [Candidatus Omnitrophota bacterium]